MSKTVWINGTERLVEDKDRYGTYHLYVDNKDIKWLNSLKPPINHKSDGLICDCGHRMSAHTLLGYCNICKNECINEE